MHHEKTLVPRKERGRWNTCDALPAATRVLSCNVCASYLVYQLSSSDRDEIEAKRMEKRAQQDAERAQKRMHKEMEKRLKQVAISYTRELS